MRLRFLLGAAIAALVLTACQPSASPPSPSADRSEAGAGSSGPIPSLVGNPELEATLPEEAASIIFFQSTSMSGPDFMDAEVDEQFLSFLAELGADLEDVSVAFAVGANADATNTAYVFAFQVVGAEAQELIDAFKAGAPADADPLEWTPETVAGKAVEVAVPTEDFPTPVALYAVGDVLYFVNATEQAAFEAILGGLPGEPI
jgi:hypothetical protein